MDPIVLPEHVFNPSDIAGIAWAVNRNRILFGYSAYALMVTLLFSVGGLPVAASLAGGITLYVAMVAAYRYQTLPASLTHPMNRGIKRKRAITLDEQGVHVTGEEGLFSNVPWSYFVQSRVIGKHTLLFMSPVHYFLVPHELLKPGDLDRMNSLVAERVAPVGKE